MLSLDVMRHRERVTVLYLGAHSDDIEIGAGGTILHWISSGVIIDALWCVLSTGGERRAEAQASAAAFLKGAASAKIELAEFRDSFFLIKGPS